MTDASSDAIEKAAQATAESLLPKNLLTVGLANGPGDVLAPIRGAIEAAGVIGDEARSKVPSSASKAAADLVLASARKHQRRRHLTGNRTRMSATWT